jgi:hypothetical protein
VNTQRLLGLVFVSAVLLAIAYLSAFLPGGVPAWAPWVFMLATTTIMLAMAALGATRSGTTLGRLQIPFAITFVIVAGSFAIALGMGDPNPAAPELFLGLPKRAAAIMYGIGLLPMVVLPFAYAWTFDEMTLSDEDWARVQRAAEEYRAKHATEA